MAAVENHLVERLPLKDRLRLLALCEPVQLVQLVLAEVLCNPGEPARHVYFPTEGFISLVAQAEQFHVTHEFLSYMLGVRRVGITAAAGALQRGGLIEYRRGQLTVLDRPGLEACGCYAVHRKAYTELME